MWLDILSDQLPVEALVGRYPPNKLIGREAIPKQNPFLTGSCGPVRASGISTGFLVLSRSSGQVPHVFLTRSPLSTRSKLRVSRSTCMYEARRQRSS